MRRWGMQMSRILSESTVGHLTLQRRCHLLKYHPSFVKKQYANVHIVKTEMKGFGLRAGGLISRLVAFAWRSVIGANICYLKRDDFIYEYIGEVVSEPSFLKRMHDYGEEGIEHFYFMMLQKDEVSTQIDLWSCLTSPSSSLTRLRRAELDALRITAATLIAMLHDG